MDSDSDLENVTEKQLAAVAALMPAPSKSKPSNIRATSEFNLDEFVHVDLVQYGPSEPQPFEGGRIWKLERCPFDEHSDKWTAYVIEGSHGGYKVACHKAGCGGGENRFTELRDRIQGQRPKARIRPKVIPISGDSNGHADANDERSDYDDRSDEEVAAEEAAAEDDGTVSQTDRKIIEAIHRKRLDRIIESVANKKIEEHLPSDVLIEDVAAVLDDASPESASNMERWIKGDLGRYYARDPLEALYTWHNGVYRRTGEKEVRKLVKALTFARTHWKSHIASETNARILADAPFLWEVPPLHILNLKNCRLDISDPLNPVKLSHDPAHLSPVQLPVIWNAEATCPKWDTQIEKTFPADCVAVQTAYEVVAWLMTPWCSMQAALLLKGPSGTGKSTFLAMLHAFLGRFNCTNRSLQKLENDRFATSGLIGKLVNICGDLPSAHLDTVSVFKQLTGNEPCIDCERKFKDSDELRIYCRHVFSANKPPTSSDGDEAFFDRWRVIAFLRKWRGTVYDKAFEQHVATLTTPSELSGVLNKALAVLPGLWARNNLNVTESMNLAHAEFWRATAPEAVWLRAHVYELPDVRVKVATLRNAYNAHAAATGLAQLGEAAFGGAVQRLYPGVKRVRPRFGAERPYFYLGIGLKNDSALKDDIGETSESK